jgi:hypothetical protein
VIVEAIISLFTNTIIAVLNFVPVFSVPPEFVGSVAAIVELLATVSYFVPVGILSLCMIVWVSVNNVQALKQAIDYVIRKIPGLS